MLRPSVLRLGVTALATVCVLMGASGPSAVADGPDGNVAVGESGDVSTVIGSNGGQVQPVFDADSHGVGVTSAGMVDPVTHRRLIWRNHVDAAHIEWDAAQHTLNVGVMEGEIKPENYREANQVAIRLGPDADADGNEITRILVPEDPAYRFLGEPGTVLWNGPMQWYPNAAVFAGIGAGEIPSEIQPGSLQLDLVDVEGPGYVVVYTNNALGVHEYLDSREKPGSQLRSLTGLSSGAHGHYNWAFSEPGRYELSLRASALTQDGQRIEGPLSRVLWLVGTDENVGLPEGTTPAWPITHSAEQLAQQQGGEDPSSSTGSLEENPINQLPSPNGQHNGQGEGTDPESNQSIDSSGYVDEVSLPAQYTCAVPDHYDMMANVQGDSISVSLLQGPEGATKELKSRTVVMPVPDFASTTVDATRLGALGPEGTRIWALPEVQEPNLVWSGLNTGNVDYSLLDQGGARFYLSYMVVPQKDGQSGRMAVWDYPIQTGLRMLLDSRDKDMTISFPGIAHRHMATSFDMPGLYEVDYGYEITYNKDAIERLGLEYENNYNTFTVFYAVGDAAIEAACPGYVQQYQGASQDPGSVGPGAGTTDPTDDGNQAGENQSEEPQGNQSEEVVDNHSEGSQDNQPDKPKENQPEEAGSSPDQGVGEGIGGNPVEGQDGHPAETAGATGTDSVAELLAQPIGQPLALSQFGAVPHHAEPEANADPNQSHNVAQSGEPLAGPGALGGSMLSMPEAAGATGGAASSSQNALAHTGSVVTAVLSSAAGFLIAGLVVMRGRHVSRERI